MSRAATPFGDLFVLADGVGGHGGGADAAQAVVSGFADYLASHGSQPLAEALQNAALEISSGLRKRSGDARSAQSMSSTVVLAVINNDHATIAHAGDSRAYLARENRLRLLTRDDSLVEHFISQGVLTPAQAREHPDSSVLTQAIGQRAEVRLTITEFAILPGDALLLCSDGLWGYAEHPEMETIALAANISAAGVTEALLNLALQGGGGDNISIQFLRFSAPMGIVRAPVKWFGISPLLAIPLGLATACLLAAGAGLAYWNLQHPLHIPNPGMHLDGDLLPGAAAAPPGRTKLVLVTAADAPLPDWSSQLNGLGILDIGQTSGTPACLSLRQAKPVLLTSSRASLAAHEIGNKLHLEDAAVIELPPQSLASCGDADLFVLPAAPPPPG